MGNNVAVLRNEFFERNAYRYKFTHCYNLSSAADVLVTNNPNERALATSIDFDFDESGELVMPPATNRFCSALVNNLYLETLRLVLDIPRGDRSEALASSLLEVIFESMILMPTLTTVELMNVSYTDWEGASSLMSFLNRKTNLAALRLHESTVTNLQLLDKFSKWLAESRTLRSLSLPRTGYFDNNLAIALFKNTSLGGLRASGNLIRSGQQSFFKALSLRQSHGTFLSEICVTENLYLDPSSGLILSRLLMTPHVINKLGLILLGSKAALLPVIKQMMKSTCTPIRTLGFCFSGECVNLYQDGGSLDSHEKMLPRYVSAHANAGKVEYI